MIWIASLGNISSWVNRISFLIRIKHRNRFRSSFWTPHQRGGNRGGNAKLACRRWCNAQSILGCVGERKNTDILKTLQLFKSHISLFLFIWAKASLPKLDWKWFFAKTQIFYYLILIGFKKENHDFGDMCSPPSPPSFELIWMIFILIRKGVTIFKLHN